MSDVIALKVVLKWCGDGKAALLGFPMRDLAWVDIEKELPHNKTAQTKEELRDQLVGTGLYKLPPKKRVKKDGNN